MIVISVVKKMLLFPAKVAGTAVLTATWLATGILRQASDVAGFELGSELFGMGTDASASGLKKIWHSPSDVQSHGNPLDSDLAYLEKRKWELKSSAAKCKELARSVTDDKQKKQFEQQYKNLLFQINAIEDEIKKIKDA